MHKLRPKAEGQAARARCWLKKSERLLVTGKGHHEGSTSGARVLHYVVGISYGRGIVLCKRYSDRWSGASFSRFIKDTLPQTFLLTTKARRVLLQDNDPAQTREIHSVPSTPINLSTKLIISLKGFPSVNDSTCRPGGLICKKKNILKNIFVGEVGTGHLDSRAAMTALRSIGAAQLVIPARSPDLNPVENVFHLTKSALSAQAVERNILFEEEEAYDRRVVETLHLTASKYADPCIASMPKRIAQIIRLGGCRSSY